ncbi:hypothetical protein [Streptosporangium sp. NPDC048865]|uniref:hypothetical protein n=1 Tax=Streptosporangium sp. NPDC048865 TaxID=3155766 RepID=UPI0034223244
MEGLKLQQPVLVGLGSDGAFMLGGGWAGEAGGANTQRGAPAGSWFAISTTGVSAVRPRQGARPQHEARSPGSQKSEVERLSGGRGRTVGTEGAGDGATSGDRVFCTGSVRREGSYTPVRVGAGRGAWEAQLGGPVRGGVGLRVGLAEGPEGLEGFGVPFGGVVGFGAVDRVGLGAVVAVLVGAGLVVVAVGFGVAVGPGGGGVGAGLVAVPEGAGVAFGGCDVPVAVGVALDVGEEVALGDGAGVAGAEVAVDVADGFVPPGGGVGAVFGGAAVGFLAAGGASVVGLAFLGVWVGVVFLVLPVFPAFLGRSWGALLVSGGASVVGLVFLGADGADLVDGSSVGLVFTGGSSTGRVLLDGGFAGTEFLARRVSRARVFCWGAEYSSTGTSSSTRGAVFR